jgi:hypothetical protein
VVNGTNGQGSEGAEVDEGCSRVMKDRAKQDGGEKGVNRARSLHHGGNAKSTVEESSYL